MLKYEENRQSAYPFKILFLIFSQYDYACPALTTITPVDFNNRHETVTIATPTYH